MKHILNILRKDFKEAIAEIDFDKGYDPYSKKFMKPLFIGQLYMALKCVCDTEEVEDELEGAEAYIEKYLATDDETYKDMAHDELHHAENLMKRLSSSIGKTEMQALESKHQELSRVIER